MHNILIDFTYRLNYQEWDMNAVSTTLRVVLSTALVCLAPTLGATETDWLELKEGHEGKKIQAKVQRIKLPELGSDGGQQVTVTIPKNKMKGTNKVHEVVVMGQRDGKEEVLPGISYEWSEDYENDNYGLIIKLEKMESYPIRVYLKDDLPLPDHQ